MAIPESEVTEIANDEVKVKVHLKPACCIELQVKAFSPLVKEARKNAVKAVGKEVSIPGFRKGKAPQEIIERKYPADVERKFHQAIADLAFTKAQQAAKIPLLNNNAQVTFDLKGQSEEGAELLFSFETEPKIPTVDPSQLQLKEVSVRKVEEKEVEEAVRQMLFFYANWKQVVERGVKEGDYIMIDLDTVSEDGSVQNVFHHIRFEVSSARMANWMKGLVLGAKSGDTLEGMSEPDETASEEEKREFVPKKVFLKLLKIEEAELPQLDDEFAQKVGAKDVPAMKKSIEDLLTSQAKEKADQEMRDQINELLIEKYPFELPASLIDTEKKHRFTQMLRDPKFKRKWEKMGEEERKNLDEKIQDDAEKAVRLFYLTRKLVHDSKIPITHKEVQDEAIRTLSSSGKRVDVDQIPKEFYALALSKVILAKAQNVVLERLSSDAAASTDPTEQT